MTEPKVIYEDKNFLAVNKPSGLLVHGTAHSKEPTLVDWLTARYPEIRKVGDDPKLRPGIVHRLDKDASGIILVPRTQEYFEYLKSLFRTRQMRKTYLALVFGLVKPQVGVIEKPIGIRSGTLKRSVNSLKMAKEAVTEYRTIKNFKSQNREKIFFTLVEVFPKTGRTHQIRVHLASVGNPVVGDRLYGSKKLPAGRRPFVNARLMLHALSLEFTTAEGRRLKLEAEPPPDFMAVIKEIRSAGE